MYRLCFIYIKLAVMKELVWFYGGIHVVSCVKLPGVLHALSGKSLTKKIATEPLTISSLMTQYGGTCLFGHPWDPKNCPDYRGVLIL